MARILTLHSIAQARTGTGKTLAFLMPILQKIIAEDPSLGSGRQRTSASDIRAIVISPTRELAEQIATEARRVTRRTGVVVQAAVGGNSKRFMLQKTQREGCHLLVGTPGRLKDLLSDRYSGVAAPKLSIFVLDEADRLLDDGFWPEIREIRELLPDPEQNNVQTLMFSATVPKEVVGIVRQTLKPGFRFVKCVRDDEQQTHERVPQNLVAVTAMENEIPTLVELCTRELARNKEDPESMPFKAIVYFSSTAQVQACHRLLSQLQRTLLQPARVLSLHGKLTQNERTWAADSFRRLDSAILLSSDVTARGMDFPNVSHVIQMGVPQRGEDYIHRIGRTGRAGKPGTGYLIVNPLEQRIARNRLGNLDLPLKHDTSLECAKVDMTQAAQLPAKVATILTTVSQSYQRVDRSDLADVYRALLGVYTHWQDKQALVDSMNRLSRYGWGMSTPPPIGPNLASKLNLGRVTGLNTEERDEYRRGGSFGGGNRGGYGNNRGGFGNNRGYGSGDGFGGRGGGYGDRGGRDRPVQRKSNAFDDAFGPSPSGRQRQSW